MAICPEKTSAEWPLLPPPASLIDSDAAPLYEKAVGALAPDPNIRQINKWLSLPVDQFPLDDVEAVLQRDMAGLRSVAKAVRCRQCKWPTLPGGLALNAHLDGLRRLCLIVCLWTRYEVAQGNHEGAVLAMQTGYAMARQIVDAPDTLQCAVGLSAAGRMRLEIEQYMQTQESPNLFATLAALPRPLANVEKAVENERKAVPSELPPGTTREQFESELKRSYDQLRGQTKELDRDMALLQCIEAIRSYAASHGGKLPKTLAETTEVTLPQDPMNGGAFRYVRTGSTAKLESVWA
ncbi:MAG TPA: hypothetical protein PKH24_13075 [Sedimentisphaerales bacterium]|nr:hypothetical protein [Sedimentisphaerales bacterium]